MNSDSQATAAQTATATDPKPDPTTDLELFQVLKPYIGHCLSMNHDINNPLAGIIGYCEFLLLEPENLTKQQIKQLEMIAKCAERIRKLVENLCEEKIALTEKINMQPVMDAYKAIAKKLD
jgi:nitrogen-specific signal transduction histidine kinase